jgi:hypothetical protein
VHIYVNGKMIPVETVPGMGEEGKRKMVEGVNSIMTYLIYCKNFCKCCNVLPPTTTIKKKTKKEKAVNIRRAIISLSICILLTL